MEKLRKGTQVKFNAINFIGEEIPMSGEIIGHADEVKRLWPEEFGGIPVDGEAYLILVRGNSQNYRYVAMPNEIIEVLKKEQK